MLSDHLLSVLCMVLQGAPPAPPSTPEGNASTNIPWMGAIQLIIFERLATTKRVVHQRELAAHTPPATLFVATKIS
jgi:hypothetical protein